MTTIGSFEAKTNLAQLLDRVAKGERIVITKRGKAVAMLVPPESNRRHDPARVGQEILAYREWVQRTLGQSFRDLAHDGHRYGTARRAMAKAVSIARCVLDGSVTLAWLFQDEKDAYADAVLTCFHTDFLACKP
jgi:prevent-host-death family protein